VLAHTLPFPADAAETWLGELPASAAVFLLRGQGEPYVSKTANLRRRLQRLLSSPAEHSRRLNLRNRVQEIEYTLTGSEFESQFLLYRALREIFPKTYAKRLRLRPAPLVKLHLENEFPRASTTTRLSTRGSNLYYGPFQSRAAAEKFESDALDFFKMRRCVDDLHPDPSFPGCIYSEMKMCLAPCFKGCTDEEYRAEVSRVQSFFETGGQSLTRELSDQRERASAELAFEEAAALHAKIEKLKPVLAQLPEIVRRIDRLQALVVQRGAEPGCVSLFRFSEVALAGPISLDLELHAQPESMESRALKSLLDFPSGSASSTVERTEHLAILKRWYYRSHRQGEIFFADDQGSWPLRRIVRGIGRAYRGEQEPGVPTFSATDITPAPS
jgi:excinuclease ABC subunit C